MTSFGPQGTIESVDVNVAVQRGTLQVISLSEDEAGRSERVTCGVEWVVDQARTKRWYVHCCRNEGADRTVRSEWNLGQQGKDPRREESVEGTARTCGQRGHVLTVWVRVSQ